MPEVESLQQEVMRLRCVLTAKDRFIKELLSIVEPVDRAGTTTHLKPGAYDAVPEGGYVPPHAHLLLLFEADGWVRRGMSLVYGEGRPSEVWLPLWWVWAVHPDAIRRDAGGVQVALERVAKEYWTLARDDEAADAFYGY